MQQQPSRGKRNALPHEAGWILKKDNQKGCENMWRLISDGASAVIAVAGGYCMLLALIGWIIEQIPDKFFLILFKIINHQEE